MKKPFLLLALGLTTACLPAEETPGIGLEIPNSNFRESDLIGGTFGGTGATARFGSAETATGTVRFNSASSITLEVDGESTSLLNLDGDGFEGPLGEGAVILTSLPSGPTTRDVLYIVTEDRPAPSLGAPRLGVFVDGNETLSSRLPSGTVVYNGGALGINQTTIANGRIRLEMGFATNTFDATLTGVDPASASNTFSVTGGTVSNGRFNGDITGGTALGGALNGTIYGSSGDQAAGTFVVDLPSDDVIGTFGATR
ncbi:hypothetical protein [Yoonia sp. SS1-5]|uniref:Transferrin-binding protein B C-lobe/N-lobe beta barrel domain-containing protein n=1 Tax=Yoonia rhodophyticola TaxID=3137370 RepID=A0AAN0MLK7_9RHOB